MLEIPVKIKKKPFFVIKFDGLRGEKMKFAIVSASPEATMARRVTMVLKAQASVLSKFCELACLTNKRVRRDGREFPLAGVGSHAFSSFCEWNDFRKERRGIGRFDGSRREKVTEAVKNGTKEKS